MPADAALPSKDDANRDGQQALQHLRTLAQILLTNSEARKLVQDFGLIGRDLFAQGASRAAERARPDPDRMDRVDDAAVSPIGGVSKRPLSCYGILIYINRMMELFQLQKADMTLAKMVSAAP